MKINNGLKVFSFFVLVTMMYSCSQSYPKKVTVKGSQGQVLSTYSVDEKGEKQGLEICNYDNGVLLKSEINYNNGKKEGLAKTYFENGSVASNIEYRMDAPIGKALYFNEDGKTRREETYTDDSQLIRSKSFYVSGKLKEFATYRVSDHSMMAWKYFNEYGELVPRKSNFIQVRKVTGRTFEATIVHPEFTTFDSVIVYSTEAISPKNYEEIVKKRKMKFSNSPMIITTVEEDFHYDDINYLILAYPHTADKIPVVVDYRLFWSRSEPIPVDNVRPIF